MKHLRKFNESLESDLKRSKRFANNIYDIFVNKYVGSMVNIPSNSESLIDQISEELDILIKNDNSNIKYRIRMNEYSFDVIRTN